MRGAEPIFLPGAGDAAEIAVAGEAALCDRRGALFFPDLGLLCVSDLHLEKGSSFARRGMLVPPYDTAATLLRLQAVIDHYRPRIVVSLGDSFHDDEGSSRLPSRMRLDLSALMAGRDWFWVSGNHDPSPPKHLGGRSAVEIALGPLAFRHDAHGDARGGGEVIGHYHPVASISTRGRSFRRRCFAIGRDRLLMPAFGAYAGGLNVREMAIRKLLDAQARVALLGRDRLHLFPLAAALPDPALPT